jgi:hypothetical protein
MEKAKKILQQAESLSLNEKKELIKLLVDSLNPEQVVKGAELKRPKVWDSLGKLHLGKNLDNVNLRDFAHE